MTDREFDIKITAGTTVTGFMLARDEKGVPQYFINPASTMPASSPTGAVGYENFPPQQEAIWATDDLRGGFGQRDDRPGTVEVMGPFRYYQGQSFDSRWRGYLGPGPAIVATSKASSVSVGAGAVAFAEFGSTRALYNISGRYIVQWDGTNWVQRDDLGSGKAYTALKAFETWLVAAAGGSDAYKFSTDGSTWTAATITGRFQKYLAVAPSGAGSYSLWGFNLPDEVRGSADPSNAGSWAAINYIGDSQFNGTGLIALGGGLVMNKEDGLYSTDSTGYITSKTPDWRAIAASGNFSAFTVFGNTAIVAAYKSLYQVTTALVYTRIHPGRYGGTGLMNGQVTALTHDDEYVYASVLGDDGDYYIMAGRQEWLGGEWDWCWHPIIYLGTNACNALHYTTLESGLPKLWFGYGNDTAYCRMTKYPLKDDDTLVTGYATATSWTLITSYGYFNFMDIIKQIGRLSTAVRNISAGVRYLTISYQVDGETSWTQINTIESNGVVEITLPTTLTGRRIRLKIVGTNSATTATAILESYVLRAALRPQYKRLFRCLIRCGDNVVGRQTLGDYSDGKTLETRLRSAINTDALVQLELPDGNSYRVNFLRDMCFARASTDPEAGHGEKVYDVTALEAYSGAQFVTVFQGVRAMVE